MLVTSRWMWRWRVVEVDSEVSCLTRKCVRQEMEMRRKIAAICVHATLRKVARGRKEESKLKSHRVETTVTCRNC